MHSEAPNSTKKGWIRWIFRSLETVAVLITIGAASISVYVFFQTPITKLNWLESQQIDLIEKQKLMEGWAKKEISMQKEHIDTLQNRIGKLFSDYERLSHKATPNDWENSQIESLIESQNKKIQSLEKQYVDIETKINSYLSQKQNAHKADTATSNTTPIENHQNDQKEIKETQKNFTFEVKECTYSGKTAECIVGITSHSKEERRLQILKYTPTGKTFLIPHGDSNGKEYYLEKDLDKIIPPNFVPSPLNAVLVFEDIPTLSNFVSLRLLCRAEKKNFIVYLPKIPVLTK